MAKVSTNITIDAEVKRQAQELFADLGLDLSTAINIYLKKAIAMQSIPFAVSREVPNAETVAAMDEFEEMKRNPKAYKRYPTFKAAMEDSETGKAEKAPSDGAESIMAELNGEERK